MKLCCQKSGKKSVGVDSEIRRSNEKPKRGETDSRKKLKKLVSARKKQPRSIFPKKSRKDMKSKLFFRTSLPLASTRWVR